MPHCPEPEDMEYVVPLNPLSLPYEELEWPLEW